eukprot:GHVN01037680.1.p1 GENE.GHVN01037680.1~~GHVN01037680.1.p1  ORF type:complete len:225 (+),score=61.60 GHVN01037680.1:230-904(+)
MTMWPESSHATNHSRGSHLARGDAQSPQRPRRRQSNRQSLSLTSPPLAHGSRRSTSFNQSPESLMVRPRSITVQDAFHSHPLPDATTVSITPISPSGQIDKQMCEEIELAERQTLTSDVSISAWQIDSLTPNGHYHHPNDSNKSVEASPTAPLSRCDRFRRCVRNTLVPDTTPLMMLLTQLVAVLCLLAPPSDTNEDAPERPAVSGLEDTRQEREGFEVTEVRS